MSQSLRAELSTIAAQIGAVHMPQITEAQAARFEELVAMLVNTQPEWSSPSL